MKQAVFTKSLSFALRPEAYDEIKAIADEQKISMADWVRAAVDSAMKKVATDSKPMPPIK
jgi:hypothetical protein